MEDQSQGLHGPLHMVETLEAQNELFLRRWGLRVPHILTVRVLLVRPATSSCCAYICILLHVLIFLRRAGRNYSPNRRQRSRDREHADCGTDFGNSLCPFPRIGTRVCVCTPACCVCVLNVATKLLSYLPSLYINMEPCMASISSAG